MELLGIHVLVFKHGYEVLDDAGDVGSCRSRFRLLCLAARSKVIGGRDTKFRGQHLHAFFPDVVGFSAAKDNVAFDLRFAVEC